MSFDIGSPHQGLRGKRKGRVNTALTNKTHGSYKQNTRFSQTKHTVLTNKTHGSYKQNTRLLQTKHTRLLQTKHTVLTNKTHGSYKAHTVLQTKRNTPESTDFRAQECQSARSNWPKNKPANPKPQQQRQQTGKRALCARKQQQTVASYAGTPFTRRPAYRQTSGLRQASSRISRPWMQHSLIRGHCNVCLCVRGGEWRGKGGYPSAKP